LHLNGKPVDPSLRTRLPTDSRIDSTMNDAAIHRHLQTLFGTDGPPDSDPQESAEWRDALTAVLRSAGPERVRALMDQLSTIARDPAVGWQPVRGTPYVNTIPVTQQPPFPR
jgi:pyruvate dehydrogenase E1 component